jgi:hypothetical protein
MVLIRKKVSIQTLKVIPWVKKFKNGALKREI